MTRAEHVAWCKARALEYVDRGALLPALTSMISDLSKHDSTRDHPAIPIGIELMAMGDLNTRARMREFIEGFN